MEKVSQKVRIGVLTIIGAMAIASMFVLASCSAPATTTSSSAADSSASTSTSAASSNITVDTAAKSISFKATATGYSGESSIHFLVNEKGGNAGQAHFTTAVTSRELFDALESIGATHGDNIAVEDSSGTIEGSDLKMTINVDGTDYIPSDLVEGDQGRTSKPRFGGNIDANEEYATGCLFCLESCSLGITSDAAYQYTEPETFTPTSNMPAKGTEVTVTMAL